MWIRNGGKSDNEILQNQFTAYLAVATHRTKMEYMERLIMDIKCVEILDAINNSEYINEGQEISNLPIMMQIENQMLLEALQQLGDRERYVFLNRALGEKSFERLSIELGLTYKGVAAIYYRAIQKIKQKMRGGSA